MAHEPIVHHAHGVDPANPAAPVARVEGPIVHEVHPREDGADAVVHHGITVSDLYDLLQAEAEKRKAATE